MKLAIPLELGCISSCFINNFFGCIIVSFSAIFRALSHLANLATTVLPDRPFLNILIYVYVYINRYICVPA